MRDDKRIRKALKTIGTWSNRANDAYAMGFTDWNGGHLISIACRILDKRPNSPRAWEMSAKLLERFCRRQGIDPKLHRYHGR